MNDINYNNYTDEALETREDNGMSGTHIHFDHVSGRFKIYSLDNDGIARKHEHETDGTFVREITPEGEWNE